MFGRLVTADPHGTAILAALCALADSLDQTAHRSTTSAAASSPARSNSSTSAPGK